MINDPHTDNLQSLWQSQATPPVTITVDDMRTRARKLGRKIGVRNLIEYIASGVVIVMFGWYATFPEPATPLWPIANIAIIIGTLVMVWNLHRIGGVTRAPEEAQLGTLIDFHRADLVRHRDSLRSVWLWYLMPFVPGLVLWNIAIATSPPPNAAPVPWIVSNLATIGACIAVFAGIILVNMFGAARLQRMIDDLDKFGDQ